MTDVKNRLADMDKLNTAVQIVYPTLFLVYNTKDTGLSSPYAAPTIAFSPQHGPRRRTRSSGWWCCPCIRSKESIDEIRFARQNGAVGVFFRGIEDEHTLDHPYLFPIYEEAQKQNLSICVHTGCGVKAILETV